MLVNFFFISLFFTVGLCNIHLTNVQHNITLDILNELNINNLVIVKPPSFIINKNALALVNFFSKSYLYVSFLSTHQLYDLMSHYNKKPGKGNLFFYCQKTMILLYEKDFKNGIYYGMGNNPYHISRFTWLIWPENNQFGDEDFQYIHIPYNAQVLVAGNDSKEKYKIFEVYHRDIFRKDMFHIDFGTWTKNKGLKIPVKNFYSRRFDVNGTFLKVEGPATNITYIDRMYMEFIRLIANKMNFRVHFVSYKKMEERFKTSDEAVLWDIRIWPFWFTRYYKRSSYGFVGLLQRSQGYLYLKYDSKYEDHRLIYYRPFPTPVWLMILTTILISGALTGLIIKKIVKSKYTDMDFLSGIYHAFEAFTNQCGCGTPKMISIRIIMISVRVLALSVFITFSVLILHFILTPNIKLPFTDVKGLVEDGSYKISFPSNTDLDDWFNESYDPWMKIAHEKYLNPPEERASDFLDQVDDLCKSKKILYVFFGGALIFSDCMFLRIPAKIAVGWLGIPLNSESPYTSIFNRNCMRIISAGCFSRYEGWVLSNDYLLKIMEFMRGNLIRPVGIEVVAPIFILLSILYMFALLLLLLENVIKKKRKTNLKCKGLPRHHIRLNHLRLKLAIDSLVPPTGAQVSTCKPFCH